MNDPVAGEIWESTDPRDNGLRVTILEVTDGYVKIQRFRKTRVSLKRFHHDYRRIGKYPDDFRGFGTNVRPTKQK